MPAVAYVALFDYAATPLEEADEDLANLMLAWYYTGFYTARFLASR